MTTETKEAREKTIKKIVGIFNKNVKGRISDTTKANAGHDGKDGHWLETQMGVKHNGKNDPDIEGFEMKNHTKSKTSFGDWSSDYSIFNRRGKPGIMTKNEFLFYFGAPNIEKGGRLSWSGKPCPKINEYNSFGQKLAVDKNQNILAVYSYSQDKRLNKKQIIPDQLKQENLTLVSWSKEHMKAKVERKFNKLGWFKCNKDKKTGEYTTIVFGDPITFENWIAGVKEGKVFFDSGMNAENSRLYATWRANNNYWDDLIKATY